MSYEERHVVPGSRPYLSGHFPGNPVVPAVIILELVQKTIGRWKDGVVVTGMPHVKFKAPLLPDVSFIIRLREIGGRAIGFECRMEDRIFAAGRVEVRLPIPTDSNRSAPSLVLPCLVPILGAWIPYVPTGMTGRG